MQISCNKGKSAKTTAGILCYSSFAHFLTVEHKNPAIIDQCDDLKGFHWKTSDLVFPIFKSKFIKIYANPVIRVVPAFG